MGNVTSRLGALATVAPALFAAACGGPSAGQPVAVGAVQMALDIAPGTTLSTVSYLINGPGSFTMTGTIDVSHSSTISASISPLPPGMSFTIALSATSVDLGTMCMGSQSFDVAARMTTSVLVHLLCRKPTKSGSVSFNGALNVCPLIDSIGSSPGEAFVGGHISLSGLGHDADGGPSPLAYQWSASPSTVGVLGDPLSQSPIFTCMAPGTASVTLSLSDGDGACVDTQTISVTCTAQ
jgi:hypothetical protein